MATYSTMPDLISSSVNLGHGSGLRGTKYFTSGTIYPISKSRGSLLPFLSREMASVWRYKEAKKIVLFLIFNIFATFILLLWCHATNSMALTAYTYLTIFDILSLLSSLMSVWVRLQEPTPTYSFGYERFEVLAVFASTMLAQLGAFFIIKESVECLIQQPEVHVGRLLVGTLFAFGVHMLVTYGVRNPAMNHVVAASSSSWLQEHMTDMSESLCHVIPGLSRLLLPRMNPFALIGFTGGVSLFITYALIDTKLYYAADTWAAVGIAIMTCGTMFPMSAYTGKILLQTAPGHILGQLDKVLREASTLDGVLEFRQEHFWTLSFGQLAGSVQVRVRRDADEQLVLAHVYNRLSNLVQFLTIQIFKDDWTRAVGYGVMGNPPMTFPSSGSNLYLPHSQPTAPESFASPTPSGARAGLPTGSQFATFSPGLAPVGRAPAAGSGHFSAVNLS